MFEENEPIQIKKLPELQWLVRYYKRHGHRKEAQEILEAIADHSINQDTTTNKPKDTRTTA